MPAVSRVCAHTDGTIITMAIKPKKKPCFIETPCIKDALRIAYEDEG